MLIKMLLIGTLIGCSYLIGDYIYKAYINRNKQLNDLIRILEIMRMDLSFGLYTLEEMFKRIGEIKQYKFSNFFENIASSLSEAQGIPLEKIIIDNINILTNENYFQDKEVEELKKLILTLGKSDIESQQRMIDLSIENIKNYSIESKEDISKKAIVYKKVALAMGITIGIILI